MILTSDRLAYLRSLAINTLITEAASIFLAYEEEILKGSFSESLLDKSHYKAQIEDIIKVSVAKVYQSNEVIDKEIAGCKILTTLLETYTSAYENHCDQSSRHFDRLILESFKNKVDNSSSTYDYLVECCTKISLLTDGNALQIFQKINGSI